MSGQTCSAEKQRVSIYNYSEKNADDTMRMWLVKLYHTTLRVTQQRAAWIVLLNVLGNCSVNIK